MPLHRLCGLRLGALGLAGCGHAPAMSYHTRSADAKQLDEGIGKTFVSVDAARVRLFANRAEAAILPPLPLSTGGPRRPSITSDSSSQSCVESLACSGPNNSVIAQMNADNSRSTMRIWSSQGESQNHSSLYLGPSRN